MINGYFILNKKEITVQYIIIKIINIIIVCLFWNSLRMLQRIYMGLGYYTPIQETINIFFQQSGFFFQFWFLGSLIMLYIILPILKRIHQHRQLDTYFIIIMIITCSIIHFIDTYYSYKTGNTLFLILLNSLYVYGHGLLIFI